VTREEEEIKMEEKMERAKEERKKEKKKERKEKKRGKGNELLFFKHNPQITSSFFSFLSFFLSVSFFLFFFSLSSFYFLLFTPRLPLSFLFSSFLRHPNLQSDLHRSPAPIVSPAPSEVVKEAAHGRSNVDIGRAWSELLASA
jgi:hypothetical protein